MIRLITLDNYILDEVKKVIKYAQEHPYDENYRKLQMSGDVLPIGDNPSHVVHIHQGFRAVYSISILNEKSYHHLSISVEEKDRYPRPKEAEVIMELFGMGNNLNDLDNVWLEEENEAINLLKGKV
jgi:hypothetical protein